MAMNLPTPATQGPKRESFGARGSLAASRPRSFASDSGESAAPDTSRMTVDRSEMLPSAFTRPGRSAPAAPKRTSFKCISRNLEFFGGSGRRQAGRADGFELFVGEDEFLVPERFGLGGLARGDALHEIVDLAADIIESGALQDASRVHVHIVGHALVGVRVCANLDDRRDGRSHHRAAA